MEVVWRPDMTTSKSTQIYKFLQYINDAVGLQMQTYQELYKYSVSDGRFWLLLSEYLGIRYSVPPTRLFRDSQTLEQQKLFPPPEFFPGSHLNYAENCLEMNDPSQAAVITAREKATDIQRYSFKALRERVHELADALREAGVRRGDVVAGVLCNSIHAVTLLLAAAAIGAVYSATAPDMGISGILDRLTQVEPKVIFFDNASYYNNKKHELLSKASKILNALHSPKLLAFVVVPNIEDMKCDIAGTRAHTLTQFNRLYNKRTPALIYEQVHFTDPLFVMYSSGTTGPPKCIVHSVGGVLLQMRKEYAMHMNLNRGDIYWQFTTTGWMMYQYQITALSAGATIVCFDGSPMLDIPSLIRFIELERITHYGTSPRWLSELKMQGLKPTDLSGLTSLRCVTSTGSVLVTDLFYFFYSLFPSHVQLASVSGGTDLMACFFMHNPMTPVIAGQLQCIALGMSAKIYDITGHEIQEFGVPGELVCDRPFPSQPIYFLSDPSGHKYKSAYYEQYPGVWHHSDFVQFENTGGVTMLGRSDGVLNPSGVRFGSAEIYSITERIPEILDALCIGQRRPTDADETVLLFIVMREGSIFSPEFVNRVKSTIQKELSPRHVPKYVFPIKDIPVTINGKKVELVVKQIVSGQSPRVSATIANPESLEAYKPFARIEELVKTGKPHL